MGSRCNLMSRSVQTDPAGTQFAWSRRISHTLGLQNCTLLGLVDPGIAQLDMAYKHLRTLLPRCRWLFREGMHCSLIPHRLPMSTCPVCSFRMHSPRRAAQQETNFSLHVFPPSTACIPSPPRRRLRISLARTPRTRIARRCWRILEGRTCRCCLPCTFRRRTPRKTWRPLRMHSPSGIPRTMTDPMPLVLCLRRSAHNYCSHSRFASAPGNMENNMSWPYHFGIRQHCNLYNVPARDRA